MTLPQTLPTYKHWRLTLSADNLAFLYFDKSHADGSESTNTFSSEALLELSEICAHLKANAPKNLVILSAKENGFAAGADIDEFTRFKTGEEAFAFTKLGNEVFEDTNRLHTETVSGENGLTASLVPDGEGEHAVQKVDGALAVLLVEMDETLAIPGGS